MKINSSLFLSSSDTTQLIMKAIMHELDYDMDDNDLKFLKELNQYNKSKRKNKNISFIYCLFFFSSRKSSIK